MTNELKTDICIVGSGPGGATLAMILARLGINVILVEKSSNINREFRGESISPDSVAILEKLQIMSYIENHGYLQTKYMQVSEKNKCLLNVDFNRFNFDKKFTIDVPQPILISALLTEAKKCPSFIHMPSTRCDSLIFENNIVKGVICKADDSVIKINCSLVVASDGRYGKLRKQANLSAKIKPLARDIIWFMVTKPYDWGDLVKLSFNKDKHIIALPTYPNMLRVGMNIPSGQYKKIRENNISYLHNIVGELDPNLAFNVTNEIKSWAQTSLLDIFTMEVPKWSIDGFILIGDASHTLTPILGQGVNQAIKDAVMLAPIIQYQVSNYQDKTI
jgi:2-polyprenyl-6-methoxyphenol hydroxylase-like FAD-dependent oxidoreductase